MKRPVVAATNARRWVNAYTRRCTAQASIDSPGTRREVSCSSACPRRGSFSTSFKTSADNVTGPLLRINGESTVLAVRDGRILQEKCSVNKLACYVTATSAVFAPSNDHAQLC